MINEDVLSIRASTCIVCARARLMKQLQSQNHVQCLDLHSNRN